MINWKQKLNILFCFGCERWGIHAPAAFKVGKGCIPTLLWGCWGCLASQARKYSIWDRVHFSVCTLYVLCTTVWILVQYCTVRDLPRVWFAFKTYQVRAVCTGTLPTRHLCSQTRIIFFLPTRTFRPFTAYPSSSVFKQVESMTVPF